MPVKRPPCDLTARHDPPVAGYIALLRGINLGSTRKIAMPELRDLLHSLGYADARTYIQSGNIVLTSHEDARQLATRLERAIEERFKLRVPVLLAPAISDSRLGVTTTARNWNTVTRLLDLTGNTRDR